MSNFSILGVIPARFASSRLPGKLLKDICGKTVLQRVYEQCLQSKKLDRVIIVTDHRTILEHARNFGAEAILSKNEHNSGTDRIAEIAESSTDYTHIINIQGDEPFIDPKNIDKLANLMHSKNCDIATLGIKMNDLSIIQNPNIVKCVADLNGKALLFSRAGIPYLRDRISINHFDWIKHIGIYGFKREILIKLSKLPPSHLELIESLEQLRWLENGWQIYIEFVQHHANGIDTEEDLMDAIRYIKEIEKS